ncbi:MAG: hypothetical protein TU35_008540 [Thermoproteus sp. AZ2]|uniref:Uncharacterized protein n=1 Tax=Thermoproteus sp. AZ2 TaxID=1609232 RepID=A0ACC6V2G0_9CREN
MEIYDAVYLAHTLHLHALSLREFVWRLRGAGLIGQRPVEMARFALRRSSLDLRLLHPTQVQYSINLSMRRLTLIGALALPRPLNN